MTDDNPRAKFADKASLPDYTDAFVDSTGRLIPNARRVLTALLQQQQDQIDGLASAVGDITDLSDAIASIKKPFIQGIDSLVGDTITRQMALVGDVVTPGNSKVYGTDGSGNRGWQTASSGATTTEGTWASRPGSPNTGDVHYVTDGPGSRARWNGSVWTHMLGTMYVTPPVLGDFSQVNFGTSSTAAFGQFTSIIAQPAVAYALRILDKAAPATPYTIECGFLLPQWQLNAGGTGPLFGCGFRNAGAGTLHLAWIDEDGGSLYRGIKMNSPTSANSTYFSDSVSPAPGRLLMFRFRDDGTNRYIDTQQGDGSWFQRSTVGRTDFLTADRVCASFNIQAATELDRIHWVHWKES